MEGHVELPEGMYWSRHPLAPSHRELRHRRNTQRLLARIQPFDGSWSVIVDLQASVWELKQSQATTEEQAMQWVALWARRDLERIERDLRNDQDGESDRAKLAS